MIGIHISVPIASWRKDRATQLLETEILPPPSTCYGALLSLVGEENREAHLGARITAGFFVDNIYSDSRFLNTVLRTLWRIKDKDIPQGNDKNNCPDLQQLWCKSELMIWCDSSEEKQKNSDNRLEHRIVTAFENPKTISRFGGWSLGESTHLINDAWLIRDAAPPSTCRTFLLDANGSHTLPIWVDHVGMSGTKYAVGNLVEINSAPGLEQLPQIPLTP